ncbi:hypothetical protein NIES592_09885 [Fischerella major NIES-592]|uniref:Uncharacterized protein n=2 Tax=Fischerella TaxID=1190 RepID=A0A1U7H0F0_9CYAN|nr:MULTISPECIES: hypothetical protein [Fischerella]OKH14367.1 hypothetical protein NIES592_09885 [Fischerella major NIES-592]PMB39546.1 hypothetical protein CEN41_21385 [Fischerella thermalis CCMEE 5330]BAU07684.1 hypothetical protein FIS3754_36170 [Fischerella sp. NIES-3754]BCX10028.1 MAG: hypothetical protein KatS3mg066_3887 [Fischerella sp.]
MKTKEKVEFPGLPLAVYREVAAHLRQVEGVEVELIPQSSPHFNYNLSQIAGLWISVSPDSGSMSRQRVEQILAYYRSRYTV